MANSWSSTGAGTELVALPQALIDVYSLDILHTAQGVMRYEEFAVRKTELSKVDGETVKFTRYNNITRGGTLDEDTDLETNSMVASQISLSVTEYGNAIGIRERLLQLSWDNLLAEAAVLLGRDYAEVRDLSIRDSCVASGSVLYTTPGAAALGSVAEDDFMDVESIREGTELLQTSNAPKFFGDYYVCFVHPHQAAYIRRDPDWIDAQNYAQTRALFNGEVGRWEDVIFIVSTHQGNGAAGATAAGYDSTLVGSGGGAQNLYRATLLADEAYALADALPVEMRDNGVQDFGRKHGIAWYGIWGAGALNSDHIIHIVSS